MRGSTARQRRNSNSDPKYQLDADAFLYLHLLVAMELEAFIQGLGILEPDIRPLIAEHIRDFDEILPSLVMGDIARWASRAAHDDPEPSDRLRPLLTRMEQAWGDGHNPVSNLIATSFVENIYDQPHVVGLLGPKLMCYYLAYTGSAPPEG
jgi:hypothetical protein